jgi:hypothetical protein
MPVERWTWNAMEHPQVMEVVSGPTVDFMWCHHLENASQDAIVGKVLCVCAAYAVAREVLATCPEAKPQGVEAVALLGCWIDHPTEERFQRICSLIFVGEEPPDLDPHGVVSWALRTATSSVGNNEAGWALETLCGTAISAGFGPDKLREMVEKELLWRLHQGARSLAR